MVGPVIRGADADLADAVIEAIEADNPGEEVLVEDAGGYSASASRSDAGSVGPAWRPRSATASSSPSSSCRCRRSPVG